MLLDGFLVLLLLLEGPAPLALPDKFPSPSFIGGLRTFLALGPVNASGFGAPGNALEPTLSRDTPYRSAVPENGSIFRAANPEAAALRDEEKAFDVAFIRVVVPLDL